MKKATVLFIIIISSLSVFSQNPRRPNPYKIAFGAGYHPTLEDPYVVSLKFYAKQGYAFEFMGYNLHKAWRLTTLFNFPIALDKSGKMRLVLGPGLHLGYWKDKYKTTSVNTKNPIVGIDAIIGFEYRIPKTPLNFQCYYQPSIDFVGNNEFFLKNTQVGAIARIAF